MFPWRFLIPTLKHHSACWDGTDVNCRNCKRGRYHQCISMVFWWRAHSTEHNWCCYHNMWYVEWESDQVRRLKLFAGICLFTYHKYLKSIQSTIPLDGHGNPILPEEEIALHPRDDTTELDETSRLTSNSAENLEIHQVVSNVILRTWWPVFNRNSNPIPWCCDFTLSIGWGKEYVVLHRVRGGERGKGLSQGFRWLRCHRRLRPV